MTTRNHEEKSSAADTTEQVPRSISDEAGEEGERCPGFTGRTRADEGAPSASTLTGVAAPLVEGERDASESPRRPSKDSRYLQGSDDPLIEGAPSPKAEGGHGEEAVPKLVVKPVWVDPLTQETMSLEELRRALGAD